MPIHYIVYAEYILLAAALAELASTAKQHPLFHPLHHPCDIRRVLSLQWLPLPSIDDIVALA